VDQTPSTNPEPNSEVGRATDALPDVRLYVPDSEDWQARVKTDSEKVYCYQKNPGENYFHLILGGELYLVSGTEKLCLTCALSRGVVTTDRLFWQNRVRRQKPGVR